MFQRSRYLSVKDSHFATPFTYLDIRRMLRLARHVFTPVTKLHADAVHPLKGECHKYVRVLWLYLTCYEIHVTGDWSISSLGVDFSYELIYHMASNFYYVFSRLFHFVVNSLASLQFIFEQFLLQFWPLKMVHFLQSCYQRRKYLPLLSLLVLDM